MSRPSKRPRGLLPPFPSEPPDPPPPPASEDEARLAARLLPHVCVDSVIDRDRHALGVARMILNGGVPRARAPRVAA